MPLNPTNYLTERGWGGKGTSLDSNGRGLKKPLSIPQKRSLTGIGKDRDRAVEWWDCLFAASAQSLKISVDKGKGKAAEDGSDSPSPRGVPTIHRTSTGIISSLRVATSSSSSPAPAEESSAAGSTDAGLSRMSLMSRAKREHARRALMSGFVRGEVIGDPALVEELEAKRKGTSEPKRKAIADVQIIDADAALSVPKVAKPSTSDKKAGKSKKGSGNKDAEKEERRAKKRALKDAEKVAKKAARKEEKHALKEAEKKKRKEEKRAARIAAKAASATSMAQDDTATAAGAKKRKRGTGDDLTSVVDQSPTASSAVHAKALRKAARKAARQTESTPLSIETGAPPSPPPTPPVEPEPEPDTALVAVADKKAREETKKENRSRKEGEERKSKRARRAEKTA